MTPKFPTDLLDKWFPIPAKVYKDKDGFCIVDDRYGLCEFLLVTGECEAE